MWLFTVKGFYSIVESPVPGRLLVRARFKGDLEKLFPEGVEVSTTPERDYMYRTIVPTEMVTKALTRETENVSYPNFKDAVLDEHRHPAYGNVWGIMYNAGDNRPALWNTNLWERPLRNGDKKSRRPAKKRK